MRMWNVDPRVLCDKHLLGEHVEMHMFVGSLLKGISLAGYVSGGLVETANIESRHEELADEMLLRGMHHRSAISSVAVAAAGAVNVAANLTELKRRCKSCAARMP